MANSLPKFASPNFIRSIKEGSNALRLAKKVNPTERYVLLYPDSDAAYVGMGYKLLNIQSAEKVYDDASSIVKKDLIRLCLEGPKANLLDSQESRQLATFVTSHATVAKLASERPELIPICKGVGGVGIGFINTLVFSGAMTFKNAIEFIQKQGQAMDRAAKVVPNARVKICILPATKKRLLCQAAIEHCIKIGVPQEIAVCSLTKQAYPHLIEISGHEEAIKYLEDEGQRLFKFRWISRIKKTPHAYNTDLMKPVKDFLRVYVEQKMSEDPSYIKEPETSSVYSSNSGNRLRFVKDIKRDIISFSTRPILTEQLLNCLFARPKTLAQPNILVLWDKGLLDTLMKVNRKARESAKLFA